MTIEQLRVLVSVYHSGSFTNAAELLGQTPSAISRKISQLEKQLNVSLFTRTTRRINVTEQGRIIAEKAQQALNVINDIEDNVSVSPHGKIKIDAPTPFLEHCILPYLNDFFVQYPKIEIELASFDEQINLIEKQVDMAFRIGDMKDSTLHYRSIGRSKLRILASPSYIEQYGLPTSPAELKQHRCIGFSHPLSLNHWPLKQEGADGLTIDPFLTVSSGSLIRQAALSGMGIVCLADFMTSHDLMAGKLLPILETSTIDYYQPINAVSYAPYQDSVKLKCFLDFMLTSIHEQLKVKRP